MSGSSSSFEYWWSCARRQVPAVILKGFEQASLSFPGSICYYRQQSTTHVTPYHVFYDHRRRGTHSARERNKTAEEKEADLRRKGNLPAMADAVR